MAKTIIHAFLYSDKTWVFAQSERTYGRIYITTKSVISDNRVTWERVSYLGVWREFLIILRLSVADALTLCFSLSSLSHFAYLIEYVGFFRGSAIYK